MEQELTKQAELFANEFLKDQPNATPGEAYIHAFKLAVAIAIGANNISKLEQGLTLKINGRTYLISQMQLTSENQTKIQENLKKYDAFIKGVKEIKQGGFLTKGYAIVDVLIPEDRLSEFNEVVW